MTTLTHSRFASPVGRLHVVSAGTVLIALDYEGYEARLMRLLKRNHPEAKLVRGETPPAIAKALGYA